MSDYFWIINGLFLDYKKSLGLFLGLQKKVSDYFRITKKGVGLFSDYFLITKDYRKKCLDYFWIIFGLQKKCPDYSWITKKGVGLFLDYNGLFLDYKKKCRIIFHYRQWIGHICSSGQNDQLIIQNSQGLCENDKLLTQKIARSK